jgi:hypothetical protein
MKQRTMKKGITFYIFFVSFFIISIMYANPIFNPPRNIRLNHRYPYLEHGIHWNESKNEMPNTLVAD